MPDLARSIDMAEPRQLLRTAVLGRHQNRLIAPEICDLRPGGPWLRFGRYGTGCASRQRRCHTGRIDAPVGLDRHRAIHRPGHRRDQACHQEQGEQARARP